MVECGSFQCEYVVSLLVCVARAEHAGQVHRVVPQRDHAAGSMAAALPARRLYTLQGAYHPLYASINPYFHTPCTFFYHVCCNAFNNTQGLLMYNDLTF